MATDSLEDTEDIAAERGGQGRPLDASMHTLFPSEGIEGSVHKAAGQSPKPKGGKRQELSPMHGKAMPRT